MSGDVCSIRGDAISYRHGAASSRQANSLGYLSINLSPGLGNIIGLHVMLETRYCHSLDSPGGSIEHPRVNSVFRNEP